MPENAKSAHREFNTEKQSEICIIDECQDGYNISADKLSCTEKPQPKLSQADSEKKIAELRDNAQAMKDKEQSTANKLIGAAGIGATGIGGMQLASAMAEQNADEDAERDMAAYLATFKCDFGQGRNITGGETNIELPGGNQLLPLYTEYTQLAADLKIRKQALGMSAGIESETIVDKADTGLYDNVSLGKTDGAYTSVARALMDETSADAAEWAKQKSDTASKLKTGATVAGIGAAGSLIANLAVNSGQKKQNKSDEIIAKYDARRQKIREKLTPVEDASKQDATQNPEQEPIKDDVAETTAVPETESGTPTIPPQQQTTAEPTADPTREPAKTSDKTPKPLITLYDASLFDSGKYTIKAGTTKLDETITQLKQETTDDDTFRILLVAHTDRDRIKQTAPLCRQQKICTNKELSVARGNAVRDYVSLHWAELDKNPITVRDAGAECAVGTTPQAKALERRVVFYIAFGDEDINQIPNCEIKSE